MLPIRLDLQAGSRQTALVWEETFLDGMLPYNFTGHTARMQVRLYGGAAGSPLLTLPTITSGPGDGIRFFQSRPDAVLDGLRITIGAAALRDLPGLHAPEIGAAQRFSYDLLMTVPNRIEAQWMVGDLLVFPGVTV